MPPGFYHYNGERSLSLFAYIEKSGTSISYFCKNLACFVAMSITAFSNLLSDIAK